MAASAAGPRPYRVHWRESTGNHRRWRKSREVAHAIAVRVSAGGAAVRFFHVAPDGTETDLPI